jgi:hypothetical protein
LNISNLLDRSRHLSGGQRSRRQSTRWRVLPQQRLQGGLLGLLPEQVALDCWSQGCEARQSACHEMLELEFHRHIHGYSVDRSSRILPPQPNPGLSSFYSSAKTTLGTYRFFKLQRSSGTFPFYQLLRLQACLGLLTISSLHKLRKLTPALARLRLEIPA